MPKTLYGDLPYCLLFEAPVIPSILDGADSGVRKPIGNRCYDKKSLFDTVGF